MNSDCPICFNSIEGINCCTTECGHKFHSSCLFKNFKNSMACPLCRQVLVEVPVEEEEEEEDDYEYEEEESEESEDEDKRKLSIRQLHEALKKQGYSETDFISFIISDYFDYNVKVGQVVEDRSEKMMLIMENICFGIISVDYRDNRSYASVLQGVTRSEDPGLGPAPIMHK